MGNLDNRFLDTSNIYSGYSEIIGTEAEVNESKATIYYSSGFKVLGGGAFGGFTAGDRVLIISDFTLTASDSTTFDVADLYVEGLNTSVTIVVNTGFTLTFGSSANITVKNLTLDPVDDDGVIFSSVNGTFTNIKATTGKISVTSITAYVEQDNDGMQLPGRLNISNGVSFRASHGGITTSTSYQTLTNWGEAFDSGDNFNPTTGIFTVPYTGNYLFCITGRHANVTFGRVINVYLGPFLLPDMLYVLQYGHFSATHVLALAKDYQFKIQAKTSSGTPAVNQIVISGCLLSY